MKNLFNSLSSKIIFFGFICITLSFGSATYTIYKAIENNVFKDFQWRGEEISYQFERHIEEGLEWGEHFDILASDDSEKMSQTIAYDTEGILAHIGTIDLSGKLLAHSDLEKIGQTLSVDFLTNKQPAFVKSDLSYDAYLPVLHKDQLYGYIVVGYPKEVVEIAIFDKMSGIYLSGMTGIGIFLITMVFFTFKYIREPHRQFLSVIEKIHETKDLSLRTEFASKDELGVLSQRFDEMMEWMEAARGVMQQASESQVHEIETINNRLTPLMVSAQEIVGKLVSSNKSPIIAEKHLISSPNTALTKGFEAALMATHQTIESLESNLSHLKGESNTISNKLTHLSLLVDIPPRKQQKPKRFKVMKHDQFPYETPPLNFKPGDTVKIMIFDDQKISKMAYEMFLNPLGSTSNSPLAYQPQYDYQIIGHFLDVKNVVELCDEHDPDLVLMDLSIPHIQEGMKALQELHTNFSDIPIVVISQNTNPTVIKRAFSLGARSYIPKRSSDWRVALYLDAVLNNDLVLSGVGALNYLSFCKIADGLSEGLLDICSKLIEGKSYKQIAESRGSTERTVKNQVSNLYDHLNMNREEIFSVFNLQTSSVSC